MITQLSVALVAAICTSGQSVEYPNWAIPKPVRACLERVQHLSRSGLVLDMQINPYYLRGDFDADRSVDLAVAVKGPGEEERGVAVCLAASKAFLLGTAVAKGPRFGDDVADRVASFGWTVMSRKQLEAILLPRQNRALAHRFATVAGEVLYLPNDEGSAVVYFSGGRFRWLTISSLEKP